MPTKIIKRARAIWTNKELRQKCLTPLPARQNRSRHVGWSWPASFKVDEQVDAGGGIADELACWEAASDEDYSSFENELD
jgi:hypothetical protein